MYDSLKLSRASSAATRSSPTFSSAPTSRSARTGVCFSTSWLKYSSCGFAKITHDFSIPENEGTHPGAARKAEILDDLEKEHADCVVFLEDMQSLRKAAPKTNVRWLPYPCVLEEDQIAEMYFRPLATASVARAGSEWRRLLVLCL